MARRGAEAHSTRAPGSTTGAARGYAGWSREPCMAHLSEPSDELHLQLAFQRGDIGAFQALVTPHLDALYTVCLRMLGDAASAEDAAQETLVRALEAAERYQPGRPLRPWLLVIAMNHCRSRLRTVWWRRTIGLDREPDTGRTPEDEAAALQRDRQVREALTRLPVVYREALTLFFLHDMTYAEMASITGAKIPALKQRVRRGLIRLEQQIARLYPDLVEGRTEHRRIGP